ncbi:MAG: hypothetical protein NC308_09785 [Clostridium sp.]|nr:hypothetical protein [Bacteroides sp.]MCM1199166.1 hypothetical protein [Clostridium sp.]
MKKRILHLVFIWCLSVLVVDAQENVCTSGYPHLIDTFDIKKIQKKPRYYIIYAVSKGNSYKIISDRSEEKHMHVKRDQNIVKGNVYQLEIVSCFPAVIGGVEMPPPGSTGMTGVYLYGDFIVIEPDKGIWDLYMPINLIGKTLLPLE